MKKALIILIIITLLVINWFIFHDFLKGETYTTPEYLTGIVTIPIIVILSALLKDSKDDELFYIIPRLTI